MDNNIFSFANAKKSAAVEKIKFNIQKYLIFFVLFFNIGLSIVSRLYRLGLQNPFTIEFFLELSISLLTTMICYICFVPFGRNDELKRNAEFPNIKNTWMNLSNTVRSGYLRLFTAFCDTQVKEEREEVKRLIIENNTIMPYTEYKEKYEGLGKKKLKKFLKQETINEKEYKAILRANGYGPFNQTKIKPINPVIILSGAKKMSINDAGRTDSSYVVRWLTTRPLVMFVSTAILNSVVTTFNGGGKNVILDMLIAVFQIIIAAVCGYSAGVSDFKYSLDRINSRVVFLSLFVEENNIIIQKSPSN